MEKKELKHLVILLERHGWRIRRNRGGHYVCYPPQLKSTPVIIATTSVHFRGQLNLFAEIKRRGYGFLLDEL